MPSVQIEKMGPVTTVLLQRPAARNAVDREMATALAQAFLDFEQDEGARVAVLAGAEGTFCAGADLKAMASPATRNQLKPPSADRLAVDAPMGPTRMLLHKPVIAALAGHAVAGGLELALWCDLRIVEEDAILGVFCRRWGVPLIDGGTVRLPRLIGLSRALDLILTGRPVAAQEALAMGLCNRVVAKGQARAAAEELASAIAAFPQLCLRQDRLSAYEQGDLPLAAALVGEFAHGMQVLGAQDGLDGAARFAGGKGRGGRPAPS